jgi:hypothetical protein
MRTEQRFLFDFVKDLLADWYQPAVSPAYVDSRDGNRVLQIEPKSGRKRYAL